MPSRGTYPDTIRRNGRTYRYVARAYGNVGIQRTAGSSVLNDEAKRLHKQGFDTIITRQKDVGWGAVGSATNVDVILRLYSAPKVRKDKKGKK